MSFNAPKDFFSLDVVNACRAERLREFDDPDRPRRSVGVIGAGIAGLVAAFELHRLGHKVTVLESSDRVGGRIRTHRFNDGTHAELGAMRIPANHHATLHYVRLCELKLRPFINYNNRALYHLRDKRARLADWQVLGSRYSLRPDEANRDPRNILEDAMMAAFARIPTEEKYAVFSQMPADGVAAEFDKVTLRQFLLGDGGLSEEAFEFVGHATGMLQYEHASFLEVLIDYFGLFRVDQFEIVEGMDRLPSALCAKVEHSLKLQHRVVGVRAEPNGVRLYVEDGTTGKVATMPFDFVICTAPAPATARIEFTPALRPTTSSALRGVHYASSAKTLVHVKKRIWEITDGIAGGGSFTDGLIQQCWYPCDNAREAGGGRWAGFTGDDREDQMYSHSSRAWEPANREIAESPGALTASYTWERNARRIASLSTENRTDFVVEQLARLHPGIEKLIDDATHLSWDQEESPGGGAFAYFAPGDHARYLAAMRQPFPSEGSRVFFAGEHLSVAHAWIQGSIETAIRAVEQVLQADP